METIIEFGLKDLRRQLQTTSFLNELEPDSGNILQLIRDGYNVSNGC